MKMDASVLLSIILTKGNSSTHAGSHHLIMTLTSVVSMKFHPFFTEGMTWTTHYSLFDAVYCTSSLRGFEPINRGSVKNGAQNGAHNDFSLLANKIVLSTKVVILTLLRDQSNAIS